jgi:hypothetical protein
MRIRSTAVAPGCSEKKHVLFDLAALHCNVTCRPLVHEKNKKAQSSTNRDESKPNCFLDFISLLPFRCDINYIINAHSQPNNREKFHRSLLKHFVVGLMAESAPCVTSALGSE